MTIFCLSSTELGLNKNRWVFRTKVKISCTFVVIIKFFLLLIPLSLRVFLKTEFRTKMKQPCVSQ